MNISPKFRDTIIFAVGATLLTAIFPATQRFTLLVGGSLLVLLILRYKRTGGQ